jgi:hypothetical protein
MMMSIGMMPCVTLMKHPMTVRLTLRVINVDPLLFRLPCFHPSRWFKSPYPALNVHHLNKRIATDTVYSDTPAINSGHTYAQLFIGTESLVSDVEGMKTDKQFVNTLEDNIRRCGAPTKLISDSAKVETSNKVKDILRALCISDCSSHERATTCMSEFHLGMRA